MTLIELERIHLLLHVIECMNTYDADSSIKFRTIPMDPLGDKCLLTLSTPDSEIVIGFSTVGHSAAGRVYLIPNPFLEEDECRTEVKSVEQLLKIIDPWMKSNSDGAYNVGYVDKIIRDVCDKGNGITEVHSRLPSYIKSMVFYALGLRNVTPNRPSSGLI